MIRAAVLGLGVACIAGLALAQDRLVIEVAGAASGTIEIELLEDVAPQHVTRLKTLAEQGAYNDVAFHRVIAGFMAQTGDVQYGKRAVFGEGYAGRGGSDLPDLPAEFSDEPFEKGVVGMARTQDPNSANSQFFIMFAPAGHLNGQYTVVGRVVEGQDVVDAIPAGTLRNGGVEDPVYMTTVTVAPPEG